MKNGIIEKEIKKFELELYKAMHDSDPEAFYNALIDLPHNKNGMLGLLNFCETYDHPEALLFLTNEFSEIAIQNEYRRFYYVISRARFFVDELAKYEIELIKGSSIKYQDKVDIPIDTLILSNVFTEKEKRQIRIYSVYSKCIDDRKEVEVGGIIENNANYSFSVMFMYNLQVDGESIYADSCRFRIEERGCHPFKMFIPTNIKKEKKHVTLIADLY